MRDIFDTHVHSFDTDTPSDAIVRQMDANSVRKQCLIAPLIAMHYAERINAAPRAERRNVRTAIWEEVGPGMNDYIARVGREQPERILPLACVDPLSPKAPAELERAVGLGCRGLKIICVGHYPWDERVFPVYEKADALGVPILFHSGILGDGQNSRFNRPAEFEIIKQWPRLRVILAHMSWPWTDEAIATVGMGTLYYKTDHLRMDLAPGAPVEWREDAERLAFGYLPMEWMLFGTDGHASDDKAARRIAEQDFIFDRLNVSDENRRKLYWENAMEFWGEKV